MLLAFVACGVCGLDTKNARNIEMMVVSFLFFFGFLSICKVLGMFLGFLSYNLI